MTFSQRTPDSATRGLFRGTVVAARHGMGRGRHAKAVLRRSNPETIPMRMRAVRFIVCSPSQPTSIISKSSLLTPHSGQTKSEGTSSHFVPGATSSSSQPSASSYIQPHTIHCHFRISFVDLLALLKRRKTARRAKLLVRPLKSNAGATRVQRGRNVDRYSGLPLMQPLHSAPRSQSKSMKTTQNKLDLYLILMRLDRPVGSLLLLWPTLAALWVAADGFPPLTMIVVFTLGTFVMRSAGCVINDYADRHVDSRVARTRNRPLALGLISKVEALLLFAGLCTVALLLLVFLNPLSRWLAVAGLGIAMFYPFMKRWTHLPLRPWVETF